MRLFAMMFLLAAVGTQLACNPCGPPCDSTVHPLPLQSGTYNDEDAALCLADGGFDGSCYGQLVVDGNAGTVTHRFIVDGRVNIVRYRVKSVTTIPKERGY